MRKQPLNIDGAGTVVFKRHPRSRRLSINIRPFGGITVSVPRSIPLAVARAIVVEARDWLQESVEEVRRQEDKALSAAPETGFVTRYHRLALRQWNRSGVSTRIKDRQIIVKHPEGLTIRDHHLREAVRRGILSACRREAAEILPQRTAGLAGKHGFTYRQVVIKNLRSRWGSCSSRGTINLNLRLVRLPDKLMDYVILHELAHTRVNNHGPAFWHLLQSVVPNARALDRELNRHIVIP
jgi:predicted metal-dependent hydrolase